MMEKLLFWAVLIWMVGLLILGIIAVRDIWRDALKDENKGAPGGSGNEISTDSAPAVEPKIATTESTPEIKEKPNQQFPAV